MTINEFEDIELRSFFNKLRGFFQLKKREDERFLHLAYLNLIYDPWIKPESKPKSFSEFITPKKPKQLTKGELLKWLG